MQLGEKCSSTHKNSDNTELIAFWASFKQVYNDTTECWMENLALCIWFKSTVAVRRPAVSIDVYIT